MTGEELPWDDDAIHDRPRREPPGDEAERIVQISQWKQVAYDLAAECADRDGKPLTQELIDFYENMTAFDEAPVTTLFLLMEREGIRLPDPEAMDDQELHEKLWEVIHFLAGRRIFFWRTDHLSDRELYQHLFDESFHQLMPDYIPDENTRCTFDMCSEDIENDARYYMDDEDRAHWLERFPDDVLPPREKARYDRDRLLPNGGPDGEDEIRRGDRAS